MITEFKQNRIIMKTVITDQNVMQIFLFKWYRNNDMKTNAAKCNFVATCNSNITKTVEEFNIKNNKEKRFQA